MHSKLYQSHWMLKDIPLSYHEKQYEICIPNISQHEDVLCIDYTCSQLKEICAFYGLKKTGNKHILHKQVYNFLFHSFHVRNIQKIWRGWLSRECTRLKGPAYITRKCVNETDFFSLEPLSELSIYTFFSFEEDGFIYGFNINYLYEWLTMSCLNPYNRKEIPNDIYTNIVRTIHISKLLGYPIELPTINISDLYVFEDKIHNMFSIIDTHGYYTNCQWILQFGRSNLIKFLKELYQLWDTKLGLSRYVKRTICNRPPFVVNPYDITDEPLSQIKSYVTDVIERFITQGINQDAKYLGCTYVLMALTNVSTDAANSLSWLYETMH